MSVYVAVETIPASHRNLWEEKPMGKFNPITCATALCFMATAAIADGHATTWVLDPALSNISFG